ncbi:MAG: tail fiber domain-containing protein, partial [Deltaproteobacteria bacterium]|nr:tail fiber domain-containing protein [Deltaproteobacteria bacterium]
NTASGWSALSSNTEGTDNTASGAGALQRNTTGKYNIGLGSNAGSNIVAGSNNIDIGSSGAADESNTIRIGTDGTQKKTYIAGISGTAMTGADVVVSSGGQLGVLASSARYKRNIRTMGGASDGLMKLRPVTFRYKSDPGGTLQYGLVAEEVARVYPELVVRGTDGKVESVRYLELTGLLLNELQKQDKNSQKQTQLTRELTQRLEIKDRQVATLQHEVDTLKQKDASISALSERLAALERQVQTASSQGLRSLASK